jgi:uncharacterized protein (TIGR02300 family)
MLRQGARDRPFPAGSGTVDGNQYPLPLRAGDWRTVVQAARFDSDISLWQGARRSQPAGFPKPALKQPEWRHDLMVKPEWGTKRTCPKCSTRFYDLGKEDPVHCIECGTEWIPEPVLKSKQPIPFEANESESKEKKKDEDLEAEDLSIDEDEEPSADDEVDLATDDDDLGVKKSDEDEES